MTTANLIYSDGERVVLEKVLSYRFLGNGSICKIRYINLAGQTAAKCVNMQNVFEINFIKH